MCTHTTTDGHAHTNTRARTHNKLNQRLVVSYTKTGGCNPHTVLNNPRRPRLKCPSEHFTAEPLFENKGRARAHVLRRLLIDGAGASDDGKVEEGVAADLSSPRSWSAATTTRSLRGS